MGKPTDFDRLINEVCVKLGFCGGIVDGEPRHVVDYLPKTGTVTAGQFASWVLEAEGLSSEPHYPYWDGLREVFIKHLGSEEVEATVLTGRITGDA